MKPQISSLMECWVTGVEADYSAGYIFYEEDLHASLYYHVRSEGFEVHVDALKSQPSISRYSPDIIVCSGKHIDALIELKYAPWINLYSYDLEDHCIRDIDKLCEIDAARCKRKGRLHFNLRIDPADGQSRDPDFILDSNTQYLFGVIAQAMPEERRRFQERIERASVSIADRLHLMTGWVGESGSFDVTPAESA